MAASVTYIDRRKKDIERTERVSKLIDEMLKRENHLFVRNRDTVLQKKGVDIISFKTGVPRAVDEKYALTCWNRDLQTYSFEIRTKNNAYGKGWFVAKNSMTQDYMLVWLRSTDEDLYDVYSLEVALISKDAIKRYLAENNVNVETILRIFNRRAVSKNGKKELYINKNIKVVQSLKFEEAPVNILISKDVLLSLSYCSYKSYKYANDAKKMEA